MPYCKNCGTRLKTEDRFCTECGEASQQADTIGPTRGSKPRNPMKKHTKVLLLIIGVLCLSLFIAHKMLDSYFSPMKQIQAMDEAISEEQAGAFLDHVQVDEDALLNKEAYLQYIKETEWDHVKEQFMQIVESEEQQPTKLEKKIISSNGTELFRVKPKSVVLGLYTTYTFKAVPVELVVSSSMDNAEVTIDRVTEKLKLEEPTTITTVYPGTYTLTAKAENMFGEFAYEEDLIVEAADQHEVYAEFSGYTQSIYSNQMEASLFMNGKDTGKKLNEFDFLGPFPEENELEFHAEWKAPDGSVLKTDTLQSQADGWYDLDFWFDDQAIYAAEAQAAVSPEEEAGDLVLSFCDAYENAVNFQDYSLIEPYVEPESDASEELGTYIADLEDTNYYYEFTSNEVIDAKIVDELTVKVTTNEQFTFTNHLDEQIDYDREKTYTVVTGEDGYRIRSITYEETEREKR
ncbi:hypothetical protein OBCHQ24_14055 [Oceanobacillus iheyensis]|nr:hypothetical protein OBCHQ24_14055 [Oceanobacillus iheyensis]